MVSEVASEVANEVANEVEACRDARLLRSFFFLGRSGPALPEREEEEPRASSETLGRARASKHARAARASGAREHLTDEREERPRDKRDAGAQPHDSLLCNGEEKVERGVLEQRSRAHHAAARRLSHGALRPLR